ncbi:MAG: hypothetical protein ACJ790_05960 [Myxococcaceae bacterium]
MQTVETQREPGGQLLRVELSADAWSVVARLPQAPYLEIAKELARVAAGFDVRRGPTRPFAVIAAEHVLVLQAALEVGKLLVTAVRPHVTPDPERAR